MSKPECSLRHDLVTNSDLYESVSAEMLSIMQRSFSLQRKISTTYNESHMNNAMLLGSVLNTFATGCMGGVKNAYDDDMNEMLGKISKLQMPSSEWLRRIFANMTLGSSMDVFDAEVQRTYTMIRKAGFDLEKWDLAIDMHLIPRYDDKYNENLIRAKSKKGAETFERYVSIQVITPGMRLVLGVLHMPALADTSDFVGMLLAKVRNLGVKIGTVMADREFFSVDVIKRFEEMNVTYLIPCRNTSVVKEALDEFSDKNRDRVSKLWLTSTTDKVQYTVIITKRRQKIKGSRRTKTDKYEDIDKFDHDPGEPPHKAYIAFATNDPDINVVEYARRWGIETGYRQIEFARVRTRSENQETRIFCFMYATMMYNVWVVLNLVNAARRPKQFEKWDGAPSITQTEMKIRILLYVLQNFLLGKDSEKNKHTPLEEKTQLTLEKIPAG